MFHSRPLSIACAPLLGYGLKLATGQTVLIDEEDLDKVKALPWRYIRTSRKSGRPKSYVMAQKDGVLIYLHRLVTEAPKGILVDHIDGNTLNCRKGNLRFGTRLENGRNRASHQTEGRTSRFRGVSWDKKAKRWLASIFTKGVQYRLGKFDSQEAAARAYDDASIILHGLHGTRNFPDREPEPIELKAPEPKGNWRAEARRS